MAGQNHTEEVERNETKTPASVDNTGSTGTTKTHASRLRSAGRWLKTSSNLRNWLIVTCLVTFLIVGGDAPEIMIRPLLIIIEAVASMRIDFAIAILLIIGLLLPSIRRVIARVFSYGIDYVAETSYAHIENQVVKTIIRRLRQRSRMLKMAARIVLVAIVITIGVGVTIFVYADAFARSAQITAMRGQIATIVNDTAGMILREELAKTSQDLVSKGLDILKGDPLSLKDQRQYAALLKKAESEKLSNKEIASLDAEKKKLDEIRRDLKFRQLSALVNNAFGPSLSRYYYLKRAGETAAYREPRSQLVRLIQRGVEKMRSDMSKSQAITADMVSGITTRIGSIFLVLFLVQIMVTLYRYNTRLAAFYDARADALELMGSMSDVDFEALVALNSPDALDFGKAPRTPMHEAVELAKTILSQASKKKG